MSIYTNTGLVKHCKAALVRRTKYMWGGIMREITPAYIALLRGMYGTKPGTGYTGERYEKLRNCVGKGFYGCDCVGLIKSYYWSGRPDGGVGSPAYGKAGFPDTNAGGMYAAARVKGKISDIPEIPGLIVYCRSHPHVGVYIGGGEVIECTMSARGDGVVKTRLGDGGWEYWFECPYISYPGPSGSSTAYTTAVLDFPAVIRAKPAADSKKLGRYSAGTTVRTVTGSAALDKKSGCIYVRLYGEQEAWIVRSAIRG